MGEATVRYLVLGSDNRVYKLNIGTWAYDYIQNELRFMIDGAVIATFIAPIFWALESCGVKPSTGEVDENMSGKDRA